LIMFITVITEITKITVQTIKQSIKKTEYLNY